MPSMDSYSKAAMERAMARKITWWQAAEIHWHQRSVDATLAGALRRARGCLTGGGGSPSPKRVLLATVEQVLGLYREFFFDLNVRPFHEKLVATVVRAL